MLCPTCTMISNVDLAHYWISPAKIWVSWDCGTTLSGNVTYILAAFVVKKKTDEVLTSIHFS